MNKQKNKTPHQTVEESLFYVGSVVAFLALFLGILTAVDVIPWSLFLRPCLFHALTGYYCPGCGGTRALRYLLQGNMGKSLYYHPLVAYVLGVYGWFMVTQLAEKCTKGKIKGMPYRNAYLYMATFILLANFMVKNLAQFFSGSLFPIMP